MHVSKMESDNMLIWLGTGIAERRKTIGLSCSQLARKVRLKTAVVHRLESGEFEMSVREFYALTRALDATLGDMVPP